MFHLVLNKSTKLNIVKKYYKNSKITQNSNLDLLLNLILKWLEI